MKSANNANEQSFYTANVLVGGADVDEGKGTKTRNLWWANKRMEDESCGCDTLLMVMRICCRLFRLLALMTGKCK